MLRLLLVDVTHPATHATCSNNCGGNLDYQPRYIVFSLEQIGTPGGNRMRLLDVQSLPLVGKGVQTLPARSLTRFWDDDETTSQLGRHSLSCDLFRSTRPWTSGLAMTHLNLEAHLRSPTHLPCRIHMAGYRVNFACVPDAACGSTRGLVSSHILCSRERLC